METHCQEQGQGGDVVRYQVKLKDVFPARSKYGNKRIVMDGEHFDSLKEAARYQELKLLERAGEIRELKRQVPFVLIPVQKDDKGKVIERELKYIADFTYIERGKLVRTVEDVKGMRTEVYKIKRKLMLYRNGIRIKEI